MSGDDESPEGSDGQKEKSVFLGLSRAQRKNLKRKKLKETVSSLLRRGYSRSKIDNWREESDNLREKSDNLREEEEGEEVMGRSDLTSTDDSQRVENSKTGDKKGVKRGSSNKTSLSGETREERRGIGPSFPTEKDARDLGLLKPSENIQVSKHASKHDFKIDSEHDLNHDSKHDFKDARENLESLISLTNEGLGNSIDEEKKKTEEELNSVFLTNKNKRRRDAKKRRKEMTLGNERTTGRSMEGEAFIFDPRSKTFSTPKTHF